MPKIIQLKEDLSLRILCQQMVNFSSDEENRQQRIYFLDLVVPKIA